MKKNYKRTVILSWSILIVYLILFLQGYFHTFDHVIYQFLSSMQGPMMDSVMIAMTHLGSFYSIIIICLLCIVLNWKKGILVSFNVVNTAIVNQLIKIIVMRERPSVLRLVVESGYSFPSAHAMVSMTLFGFLAYMIWEKQRIVSVLLVMLSIMIGITRIYVGVHYASDVMAGFLCAITYLVTVIPILKYHKWLPES